MLQDRQFLLNHYGLNRWAWDFGQATSGWPVYAARSGVVAAVETGYPNNNGCLSCDPNTANRVVVDHGDGTAGLYMHLAQEVPARLHVGDPVVAGVSLIGYADTTGQTDYPNLHYAVQTWSRAWNGTGIWYKPSVESLFYADNSPKMVIDGHNPTMNHSPYPSGNCTGVMTPTLTLNMGAAVRNRQVTLELLENTSAGRLMPPLFQGTARADITGTITFTLPGMIPNSYTLRVKPRSLLQKQIVDVNIGWTTNLDLQAACGGGWYLCAGDIMSDNKINGTDLTRMLLDWLTTDPAGLERSDLTGDGQVDATDLSRLLLNWGKEGDSAIAAVQSPEPLTMAAPVGELSLTLTQSTSIARNVPASVDTFAVGDVVTLTLGFNTSGGAMNATDVVLDYDQCVLEPQNSQISHSGVFSNTIVSLENRSDRV